MLRFDFSHSMSFADDLASAISQYQPVLDRFKARTDGMIGWTGLPRDTALPKACLELVAKHQERFDHILVLGIGGSSNGLKAIAHGIFGDLPPELIVQESPDNKSLQRKLEVAGANPHRTWVNVVSKSGNTIETLQLFEEVKKWIGPQWMQQVVVTTEENKGTLFQEVGRHHLPHLPIPHDVGGRFSALSAATLFPLSVLNVDIKALLYGASKAFDHLQAIFQGALFHFLHLRDMGKNISIMMGYGDSFKGFTEWWVQLWAESLGKNGKGQTPIATLGPQDQHTMAQLILDGPKDKLVTFLTTRRQKEDFMRRAQEATTEAFVENCIPVYTVELEKLDEENLGELIMSYQIMVSLVGFMMGVNPFDQPGVQRIKGRF